MAALLLLFVWRRPLDFRLVPKERLDDRLRRGPIILATVLLTLLVTFVLSQSWFFSGGISHGLGPLHSFFYNHSPLRTGLSCDEVRAIAGPLVTGEAFAQMLEMDEQQCAYEVANLNRLQIWLIFKLVELGGLEVDPDYK